MTQHGIRFPQLRGSSFHPLQRRRNPGAHGRDGRQPCLRAGEELVQRRVQKTHRDGRENLKEVRKILALHLQELLQSTLPLLFVCRQNHLSHSHNPLTFKEHVLGANQANSLSSEELRSLRVTWRLCIATHLQGAVLIRPRHDGSEGFGQLRGHGGHLTQKHFTCVAIDGHHLTLQHCDIAQRHATSSIIHLYFPGPCHTWAPHGACHHRGMARDTAARRQHALRCMEAVNVIGAGFDPHQQHLLSISTPLLRLIRCKDHLPRRRPRRRRQSTR
mmetsp:Transcript_59084/g.129581  ORF Transcript_59084/g.129581 Transcript_59084/m.129581 type:complete len:274 (-) Transcript_59084:1291-2112(-)